MSRAELGFSKSFSVSSWSGRDRPSFPAAQYAASDRFEEVEMVGARS
jgi:hypothetical protein